jgi:Ca2+-binding RTX toxin-like protein
MGYRGLFTSAITVSLLLIGSHGVASDAHQYPHYRCFGYEATIIGTEDDDVLVGTPGQDIIIGLGGNDLIRGLGGDDLLCGGEGNDRVMGDDGDDLVKGGEGNDEVRGGPGHDRVMGNAGEDFVYGGPGNDLLRGSPEWALLGRGSSTAPQRDSLYGGTGDDLLMDGIGIDRLDGQGGADSVGYGAYVALIDLQRGIALSDDDMIDHLFGIENVYANVAHLERERRGGGDPVIIGDDSNNILIGSRGADHIYGRGGDDFIDGFCGEDLTLDGGHGDHDVVAFDCMQGVSADLALGVATDAVGSTTERFVNFEGLVGSLYPDTLMGDDGPNMLLGAGSNDLLVGRGGEDILGGGDGFDTVDAGEGNDVCLWVEEWLSCEAFASVRSQIWPFAATFPTGYN